MENSLIRKATELDLPIIEKLIAELIGHVDDRRGIDAGAALENCRSLLRDANSCILLAEVDGVVVGLVNTTIRRTLTHGGSSGLIDELVVARSHRASGLGGQLMSAAIEHCRQLGCCEVEVSTEFSNAEAREFYRNCGFEERGVILEMDL